MWQNIYGHDETVQQFRTIVRNGRLASTFLFAGPSGIGKRTFAMKLAQSLLCTGQGEDPLHICGQCESCQMFERGGHPDLFTVALPEGKSKLPISLFVGDKDHRNQEGLCHHLSLKPFMGRRKIGIIDDADHFNQESANCLLKTLEEPPPDCLLILIGTSPSRQLPTIRSRSQLVRFRPLDDEVVAILLLEKELVSDEGEAKRLAAFSHGSLTKAQELADDELRQFAAGLESSLHREPFDPNSTVTQVLSFVESAGKEASLRRARLKNVLETAADYYRKEMRSGLTTQAANRLEHCLDAIEMVDRNANQTTLVHWWAERLPHDGFPKLKSAYQI